MWKASLPANLVMYLLAAIRAASNALEETCSLNNLVSTPSSTADFEQDTQIQMKN
jgi:L-lactate utilization protein LutC